ERRAGNLTSGVDIIGTRPKNDSERRVVVISKLAKDAAAAGDELTAMRHWQTMADEFKEAATPGKTGDPEERQWYLLALQRVQDLENRIKDRRVVALERLAASDAAFRAGRPTEAVMIKSQLIDEFGKYTDLADLLGQSTNIRGPDINEG